MSFVISPLPLRRGILALCALPAAAEARAAVLDFAPALILSLTPDAELSRLGAADLPEWCAAVGIRRLSFPVEDFQTPPEGADWAALSAPATAVLRDGGRVLVHCRGGLGRSGMVALRLMVEAGEAPDAALLRLRAARPGAVETEAQERWAGA
ncbi:dual specificity protein phosphatase family protein [Pararhodobacter aggregans]|uniref:Protein phosphatase n=1 Tax=Pararhodobacter aggregans TaxID=404875 RepID=A0A2T7UUB9_9RHOB|nr:dual specificity protein phosphatase family protein [Pararhodobacter aggregans]PTX04182.1 protein-tyrosine phosphatase [Pararhodobacter aggregans]PVE48365.1 protein phosphatase [Pararhodobacter aggregans]